MFSSEIETLIIFFPLMELKNVYQLTYGDIGPVSQLLSKYPLLERISPALTRNLLDGENIKDPVVAIAKKGHSKFINEIQCITFLATNEPNYTAADEILGQKALFTTYRENDRDWMCINKGASLSPIESFHTAVFRDFPKMFIRWDSEVLTKFETCLSGLLQTSFYRALVKCLSDDKDKEVQRERSRIIISITLFNDALINQRDEDIFSKHEIILLAAAFEALLNLPTESLRSSFTNVLMTLLGIRTTALRKWCEAFYDLRSSLVHGDTAWEKEKFMFSFQGKNHLDHAGTAQQLFACCLRTKLFLMGFLPNPDRTEFDQIKTVFSDTKSQSLE